MNFIWELFGYKNNNNEQREVVVEEEEIMLPKQPNLIRRNSKRFVIGDENEDVNYDNKNQEKSSPINEEWNRTARFLTVGTTLTWVLKKQI